MNYGVGSRAKLEWETFGTRKSSSSRCSAWLKTLPEKLEKRYSRGCAPWTKASRKLKTRRSKVKFLIFRQGLDANALHDSLAITTRVGFDGLFVESQQTSVAHHDAAVNDHCADVAGFRRIDQVGIDVVVGCLI